MPLVRPLLAGAILLYWLGNAVIWHAAYEPVVELTDALVVFGIWTAMWAAAMPFIARWMAAWAARDRVSPRMVLQLVGAAVAAVAVLTLARWLVSPVVFETGTGSDLRRLLRLVPRWGDLHLATFAVIALGAHARARAQLLAAAEQSAVRAASGLSQARWQYLQRQLRPHFLFNVLNAVSVHAHTARDRAGETLRHLRTMLLRATRDEHRECITLREELEVLRPYLELQQVRFAGKLTIEMDVPADLADCLVPQLLLQPLVENAIHHGTSQLAAGGRVSIRAAARDGGVELEVRDNGPGLHRSNRRAADGGLGLRNTRDRLRHWFGPGATLEVVDLPEGGVRALIRLPARRQLGKADPPPVRASEPVHLALPDAGRLTRRVQVAWLAWGVLSVAEVYALASSIGRVDAAGMLVPLITVAYWVLVSPLVVRLAIRLQGGRGRWRLPRALAIHAVAAAIVAWLAMRVPLDLAGFGHLALFEPGPLNTIAQSVMFYALIGYWVELEWVGVRIRAQAARRAAIEAELAELHWQNARAAFDAGRLVAELDALRQVLADSPAQLEARLARFTAQLRRALEDVARNEIALGAELEAAARLAARSSVVLADEVPDALRVAPIPAGTIRELVRPVLATLDSGGVSIAVTAAWRGRTPDSGIDLVLAADEPVLTLVEPPPEGRGQRVRLEYADPYQVHLLIEARDPYQTLGTPPLSNSATDQPQPA